MARGMKEVVRDHERWRARCLNLIPSENMTSPAVRAILSSDLGHRYTLPLNEVFDDMFMENAYRGTIYTDEAQVLTEKLARQVFRCRHAYVNSLSGHNSVLSVLLSTCRRRDLIMAPSVDAGGYNGWVGPYLPEPLGLRYVELPFDMRDWDIDHERAVRTIMKRRPALVVLGLSYFPFPFDIGPIREACDDAGALICYDASHVLGLIAGRCFQQPLREGADIMIGSTHKTFFGPQGGVVLTDDDDLHQRVLDNATWRSLDNAHWNRIAALGQALSEMRRHGKAYASQVVRNSKALAAALAELDVPLRFAHRGYTESHQVMMDAPAVARRAGRPYNDVVKGLEAEDIIVDSVGRVGTAEVTRIGMREGDMEEVAALLSAAMFDGRRVSRRVRALRRRFDIAFC